MCVGVFIDILQSLNIIVQNYKSYTLTNILIIVYSAKLGKHIYRNFLGMGFFFQVGSIVAGFAGRGCVP